MESRNSRLVKPGTASGRPTGRSQNRNASKGVRKNSRAAGDGSTLAGVSTSATATQNSAVSGRGTMAVRTGDVRVNAGAAQGFKNMPMGRTTEMFNPAPTKKDGFFVHKRGQGYDGLNPAASSQIDQQHQPMTMEQLAREGAQQAIAQGAVGSDEDDTTAMSDLNSLQNFSYYGRRFQDRNNRMQESPVASDAVSLNNPRAFAGHQNKTAHLGANQTSGGLNDTSNDTMSENVSNFTGFMQQNQNAAAHQARQAPGSGAEYQLEEKMNNNLMRQFQPMLSDNVTITKRPVYKNEANNLLKSVSDFSQNNTDGASIGGAGGYSGTQSRAQLFAQAKETLMAQQRAQNMAKTATNFNQQASTKVGARNASGSATRVGQMVKTTQNFMPKKGASAAKVLPPKLPPRAAMSPATNSFKGANLSMASQGVTAAGAKPQIDSRDNIYYPNHKINDSTGLNSATNQSEIVYKRGARSISKRRTTSNNQNKNQLNLTTVETPTNDSSLIMPTQASRQNLLLGPGEEYQNSSQKNLLVSDSKRSLNTEQRREKYMGTCQACRDRQVDGHEHSVSHSLDQRLKKFNQNFKPSGHCKRHDVMGCEKCSMGSSKGSRVSSLDSGGLVAGKLLQRHTAATRSDVGINQKAKITKSMTRQMKRPRQVNSNTRNSLVQQSLNSGVDGDSFQINQRIRSLPREESQTIGVSTPLIDNSLGDVRRSTKNAEVRQLTGKLMQYGKRGNRPSANQLPKPGSFAISEVKVRVTGRDEPTHGINSGRREDSSDSRGYSEYVHLKGDRRPGQIPNFSRILSAKTAQTSIQRREMQTKLQQRDHSEIRKEEIQQLAKEWEGDPHDPAFWQKFEGENSQTNLKKRELMQGLNTKNKQEDVLDKQSNVFRQLKEQDELMSNRDSMLGTQMGFGAKASVPNYLDVARRSNASFFNNQHLQTHADEPIQTEIDQNEYSMFQQNHLMLQSTKNINGPAGGKRLLQDPSQAVLTDYDIADEVGQQFGQSFRHQIEFRDKNAQDTIVADSNIDDMKRQLQAQLQESKPPKQVDDVSVRNQQNLFSGQTIKTGVSPAMNVSDLDHSSKRASAARTVSNATAGFPSAQSKSQNNSQQQSKSQHQQPGQGDKDARKPSGFDEQDKDSEDAESFDDEKQKSQVLRDLQMMGDGDEDEDGDEAEPTKPVATDGNHDEHVVSERSDDDEDEKRKKEIEKKTMANVIQYDDWLEAQTQKEIERQSQAAFSPRSSKLQSSLPKHGVVFGGAELDRAGNMTQMITKSASKLDLDIEGKDGHDRKQDLVDNIREGTMRNTRPKTRGEPAGQTLDMRNTGLQFKDEADQVTSDAANDAANKNQQVSQDDKSGNTFSARRKTQNDSNSSQGANQIKVGVNAKFAPNATQKSPNLNNAVQFIGSKGDHLSSRSPDKTTRGLAVIQSKGLITSEGIGNNNNRSRASFTNFASSLKEDDLMISSSMVDPLEQSKQARPASKLNMKEQLAIQEESSSLKSVSPLTENSASRKSHSLANANSPDNIKNRAPPREEASNSSMLPPAGKPGLPPKSPFLMKAKKLPELALSPKEKPAPNFVSFSGEQAQPSPKRPSILPEVKQSPSRQQASLSVLSPSRQSSASRKPYHDSPSRQLSNLSNRQSPSMRYQKQQNMPQQLQKQQSAERQEMTTLTDQKPQIGQRNQAVHDFLAFEDSDSDDFGVMVKKSNDKPVGEEQKQYTILPEIPLSPKQEVKLSPPRPSTLSKTPSAQFVPNAQFQRSNPAAMPQLAPFDKIPNPVAKTPNTGLSSAKVKALALANEKKLQTAVVSHAPIRHNTLEDDSVNEQVNRIDYNQDNEGMSASFYRQHDQWLAMQGTMKTNEYGQATQQVTSGAQTPGQPPLQSMQSLRSHRSSRSSNRRLVSMPDARASSHNRPVGATNNDLTATQKIAVEAMEANKQVQDLRKSLQVLPNTGNKLPLKRDDELRQSGTGTAGYKRPQGYVKKALQNQTSKSALDVAETSQERQGNSSVPRGDNVTPDKQVGQDLSSNKGSRAPNFRPNSTITSDSKRKTNYSESKHSSGSKKQAFFNKHKDSIGSNVLENAQKRKENSQSRGASRDRLYNQETIASILKRNPELAYSMKDKKPPAAPPRRPAKKKVVKPPTPEPPKEDPPEEPLVQSPRVLQLPIEAGVPDQECYPTNVPLPMTLPEEPPAEPQSFIMPNLFCPVDPDTPYNFEIEPREEEFSFAPIEPLALRLPMEPDDPPYPERMIKSNIEDIFSEKLEEPEIIKKFIEPDHDDEPMLPYPKQTRPMLIPPTQPTKDEPKALSCPEDPEGGSTLLTESQPERHYMTVDDLFKTHEMSVQCEPLPEDEEGAQQEVEETKEQPMQKQQELSTILEEPSDEDNFSVHSCEGTVGKVTVGIQTNEAHFRNVTKTEEFKRRKQERMESTDWALSPIFDDIEFAKEKKTIGGRKLMTSIGTQITNENCGNQVEEEQILQETAVQILSQIECEYNVDQLKRKMAGKDMIEDDRLTELYRLGLNTLKALMLGLRLEKEWEVQIKHQYALAEGQIVTDPDETIKLLTRNKKMYEAKTLIQRLLKMICQRDAMVEVATTLDIVPDMRGGSAQNIQLGFRPQPKISRESMAQIKRLSTRIASQINTLQEEHRIFKRPFILRGQEYLKQIQSEGSMLEDLLSKKFFVDESGTAGTAKLGGAAQQR